MQVLLERFQTLFGDERLKGWFKMTLQMMTARIMQVPHPKNVKPETDLFDNPAPFLMTTTRKLVLQPDMDEAIREEHIDSEQAQLDERIFYVKLKHNCRECIANKEGPWANVKQAPICTLCYSRLLRDGRDSYLAKKKAASSV